MKLVTLNANSYCGKTPLQNMENLITAIAESDFDLLALQEINQLMSSVEVPLSELNEYYPCQDRVPIKADNYLYLIAKALQASGQIWYWTWCPVHVGWSKYDEGIGILSRHPIRKTNTFLVSKETNYWNIKTRRALGVQCDFNGKPEWFYTCHFDKWNEPQEPFDKQWDRFVKKACDTPAPLYVMGDFNNDASNKGEAYDYILQTSNLIDTFKEAEYHDNGITVGDFIAGWVDDNHPKEMRIDYIFSNTDQPILSSQVIFNGTNLPVVSDHYGIEVDFGEKEKVYKTDKSQKLPEFISETVTPAPPSITNAGILTIYDPVIRTVLTDTEIGEGILDILDDILDLLN